MAAREDSPVSGSHAPRHPGYHRGGQRWHEDRFWCLWPKYALLGERLMISRPGSGPRNALTPVPPGSLKPGTIYLTQSARRNRRLTRVSEEPRASQVPDSCASPRNGLLLIARIAKRRKPLGNRATTRVSSLNRMRGVVGSIARYRQSRRYSIAQPVGVPPNRESAAFIGASFQQQRAFRDVHSTPRSEAACACSSVGWRVRICIRIDSTRSTSLRDRFHQRRQIGHCSYFAAGLASGFPFSTT